MKKSLIALALVGAFAAPAFAQTAAPAEAAVSEHTFTSNVGLFSSYRFRGIDQTFGQPALQGGFDYSHASGFYVGNWNSNVSSGAGFAEGNLEMDFYGGYKTTFGDFGIDVGALYYYYPGSSARPLSLTNAKSPLATAGSSAVDNGEIYIGASWKFLSVKYSYAVTDYFSLPESKGTSYLDLAGNFDLGDGWGINGHVGHLYAKDYKYATAGKQNISYTDWKVGVTKDIGGWIVGASYIDTNAKGSCAAGAAEFYCFSNSITDTVPAATFGSKTKDAGRGIAVVSVSRTF